MELQKAIKSRRSVKKFSGKKPDWRDIIECIDSSRYAPIASNDFLAKFIIIDNKDKIEKISDAAQQSFIAQANYVVVIYSDNKRIKNSFGDRGEKYSRQQVGAAIENFLLSLEEKGLATCWIGHFVDNQIRNILKIPDNMEVEAIFPIGYEVAKKGKQKNKVDINRILNFNEYRKRKMKEPRKVLT